MVPDALLALDVALLLPPAATATVGRLNARLAGPPAGFRFDATHLPHVSLVQQFSPVSDLGEVTGQVAAVLARAAPLRLTAVRLDAGDSTTSLALDPTRELAELHAALMDRLAAFDVAAGDERAFVDDGAPPRSRDIAWVTRFRTAAAYRQFQPHVTLGVGALDGPPPALAFDAATVALCHLGRFCTCRRTLASWALAPEARA